MPTVSANKNSTQTSGETRDKLHFKFLPGFAQFLLTNKLDELIAEQLRLSREEQIPLLKFFESFPEEKLLELSRKSNTEFLTALKENKIGDHLLISLKNWKDNRLPLITREQVATDDITLVSFVRKKALLKFIPEYTVDPAGIIELVKELDQYILQSESKSIQLYVDIQQEQIKQNAGQVKIREDQHLEAQEIANLGSFVWDLVGRNSSYTRQVYKIFEMDQFDNLESFLQYVHPSDRSKVEDAIADAINGNGIYECEYRFIKNKKEKVIWSRGIVTFQEGKPFNMKGTIMDVTARNNMIRNLELLNEEWRKSEERYHRMIDEVQDYAILLLGPDGEIQNWNKGAEKIKGYKAEEIIGKNFRIFYTEEDKKGQLPERLIRTAREQGRATNEGWRVRKDGSTFWGSIVITALHDEANNIIGFTKVTRDLTERKSAEDKLLNYAIQLDKKNKELESSNKELTSFSYVASHDLQEPLRKIQTFGNRILEKEFEHLSETGQDTFRRMVAASERMQKLIEDLLAFSRTHTYSQNFEPVDLNTVRDEVKSLYKEVIKEKKVIIESDTLPVISGIAFQIHQLFENLISNSIKYCDPNVPPFIRISSEIVDGDKMKKHSVAADKKYYRISIKDNGIGFDQKHANKIFEIFQRLHGKTQYPGTGIGLAICKKIVENHHGFIEAKGKEGAGATFNIFFPVTAPSPDAELHTRD